MHTHTHIYIYIYIYTKLAKKLAYFLRKTSLPIMLAICFENMILSFENMISDKKFNYMLRKCDLV